MKEQLRKCRVIVVAVLAIGVFGCGEGGPSAENLALAKKIRDEVPEGGTTTTLSDPSAELQKIAERGKAKAPAAARDGWKFVDVQVESIKTASLTYPFAGRIMADYKKDDGGRIDRCAVYLKHDGTKWAFHKFSRGGVGPEGWPPLKAAEALVQGKPPYNSTSGAHAIFTIWLP